ncbi:uncharacterized protein EI90DRAFT_3156394 [Cantharellus anzutake]|uniref:uncharacterized protein n=1 Tax=Cantharellus anzutake TaxID=1750568 RepID=UPI0019047C53|nr:uncharacterized protein EI90DRAFT_3156394 [Cantharellus anzutake]KAF8326791.1 hypothetical protein EI90DRAFT_3156394 [Cantharellus anzutake]
MSSPGNGRGDKIGSEWERLIPDGALDETIVRISGDERVETACERLVSSDEVSCLLVTKTTPDGKPHEEYLGLFDFADVNVFLLLAIGAYVPSSEELAQDSQHAGQLRTIITAVKEGSDVFVKDAFNLSEKNDLLLLQEDQSTVISLLQAFSQGRHCIVIRKMDGTVKGVLSDRRFVRWLADDVSTHLARLFVLHPGFQFPPYMTSQENKFSDVESTLALPLCELEIGVNKHVVSLSSEASVLDAMRLMCEENVSSVAVVDTQNLLSAVSVTDIGKLVATSEDRAVLTLPLNQFISMIKFQHGFTDGEDLYPVYSVTPLSSFKHTIDLLLATNAHRAFITATPSSSPTLNPVQPRSGSFMRMLPSPYSVESSPPTPSGLSPTTGPASPLYGVVSVVDILLVIARIAGLVNIDPNAIRGQRKHMRTSSLNSTGVYAGSLGRSSPMNQRTRSM